jgi:hypothetical protein
MLARACAPSWRSAGPSSAVVEPQPYGPPTPTMSA